MPKANVTLRNAPTERTIYVRMEGKLDAASMREFADEYRKITDSYAGGPHYVLADMRGMVPAQPEVAQMLGSAIGYARSRGVKLCAHVSDDTVQRLQAARLARQNAVGDGVTVECVSPEEAERVLRERRDRDRSEKKRSVG